MIQICLWLLVSLTHVFTCELKAGAFVHRHGHRNPVSTYPTDPNKHFRGGLKSLVQLGVQEMYYHGQRLGKRYGTLVKNGGLYSAENINVISSALERSIMSGLSLEAGLLYAVNHNLPISWQPVPITTLSEDEDNMINPTKACPKYTQQFQYYLDNPPEDVLEFLAARPGFYETWTEKSGSIINNTEAFNLLYDCIKTEKDLGLNIPIWANDMLIEGLWLYQRDFELWTETKFMKKAQYGALINDILNKFLGVQNGTDTRQIFHYSGHDSTVLGLSYIIGVSEQITKTPDYGATISLELHFDSVENSYNVRPFYWENANTKLPKELYLPKCGHNNCTLNQFYDLVKEYLIDSRNTFNEICKVTDNNED